MNAAAFHGKLVRLCVCDPEKDSEIMARWNQDSEYQQLQASGPATLWSEAQIKEWLKKEFEKMYSFTIRTLAEDRVIGSIDLSGIDWVAGNAWVSIGIGERDYWGKGYGSDAMRVLLEYAFGALNLKRVSLSVFDYNQRAVNSYCKCGFGEEGRLRQWMQRGGERYDLIFMGVLRDEWEKNRELAVKFAY